MLVAQVRVLKVGNQLSERAEGQGLVHQVLAPAHAQRAVAAVAVDAQDHVVEVVAGELGLKADGETLQGGQAVGQVAGGEAWGVKEFQVVCVPENCFVPVMEFYKVSEAGRKRDRVRKTEINRKRETVRERQ